MKKLLTILKSLIPAYCYKESTKETPIIPYTDFPLENLLIRIIDPEAEALNRALGITEERLTEIGDGAVSLVWPF